MLSPKAQAIADLYTQRFKAGWGRLGEKPYRNYGYWSREDMTVDEAFEALADRVARAAGVTAGDRVLEVGCGTGAAAVDYTRRYRPASVLGLDAAALWVDLAREYVDEQGLSDVIRVRVGDATKLDVPDASVDRVIGIECALHFHTRQDFLREAFRVLVPGGGLGLSDIILRKGADRDAFLAGVHFPVGSDGSLDVPENVYDRDAYAGLLVDAGFTEVRVEPVTEHTLPRLADYLERSAEGLQDERGPRRRLAAQIYREHLRLGLEYVLVSARKPRR